MKIMKSLQKVLTCALFLGTSVVSPVEAASRIITSEASPNNHILLEERIDSLRTWGGAVLVSSDIPVTIQRYKGDATLPDRGGCQENPIGEGDAIILVTSNCDTTETITVPNISLGEVANDWGRSSVNSINITLDLLPADVASMNFLEPSSYKMERSYTGCTELFCGENPWGTFEPTQVFERPTSSPSNSPTISPTNSPSMSPTPSPTMNPTKSPATESPTKNPNKSPSTEFESLIDGSVNLDTPNNIAATLEEKEKNEDKGTVIAGELEGISIEETDPDDYITEQNSAFLPQSVVFSLLAIAKGAHSKVLAVSNDTCTYNAEIFINGCAYDRVFNVTAPKARVADANSTYSEVITTIDEKMSEFNETVEFTFPEEQTSDLNATFDTVVQVKRVDDLGYRLCSCCACVGRPYIDASGSQIQAIPLVAHCIECSNYAKNKDNEHVPTQNEIILGEEWTQSALGEHASVASFSAFSIALMTNGAPSDLVADALKAGLDEIRHAEISFEIASKLTGGDIIMPGPLPKSTHVFNQNMTEMALAVAREGCIDETLSALAAAAEADAIKKVVETGSGMTKYLDITDTTLIWIQNELSRIALDESNHSALAWRTIKWVCSIDPEACSAVNRMILAKKKLAFAFHRRFDGLGFDEHAMFDLMAAWSKISTIQESLKVSTDDEGCEHVSTAAVCTSVAYENTPLLTSVAKNIVQSVTSCSKE